MNVERIFDIPQYQREKYPLEVAFATKKSGVWNKISTSDYIHLYNKVSRGLLRLGMKPNEKVAVISSKNLTEWQILDIGLQQVGVQNVPIYPTSSLAETKYILHHSEAVICVVSDQELFYKVQSIRSELPLLRDIYAFNDFEEAKSWQDILRLGEDPSNQGEVEAIKATITPQSLATIVYTSGTTGTPKGVMLSHGNIVSNVVASKKRLPIAAGGVAFSFLPTCHVYERTLVYLYQYSSVSVYFAESMDTIGSNINEVKPHIMTAVPRVIEKLYDKIYAKGQELSGIKRALFMWALALGFKYEPLGRNGFWYEFKLKIANILVFKKWREALGNNLQYIVSGSAALQPRLARVFTAGRITIVEGYGVTETSPVISVANIIDGLHLKFGTTGHPIDGVEVKIAPDGEILCKGPNVMLGYYKDPEKTSEAIKDGYYHTGDVGQIDEEGFLKITDRKKEIFKTSGGKFIAPQYLENIIKQSPFIEQIMVVGEGEKMPAAIIQPNFEYLQAWAKKNGTDWGSITNQELVAKPEVKDVIAKEIEAYNKTFSKWEQVKVFELTSEVWSINEGYLTSTLKMKRKEIKQIHMDLYHKMYDTKSGE